jgi:hypothetical protein
MSKIRREKRKLRRLSKNPEYIKNYNKKVRKHNESVYLQRKRAKRFEYMVFAVILVVFCGILVYKLWQK